MKTILVSLFLLASSAHASGLSVRCDDFGLSRIDNLDLAAQTADVTEKTCLANVASCRETSRLRAVFVRNDDYSPMYQAVDGSRIEFYRGDQLAWSLRLCDLVTYPARAPSWSEVKGGYHDGPHDADSVGVGGNCKAEDIDAIQAALGVHCVKEIVIGVTR